MKEQTTILIVDDAHAGQEALEALLTPENYSLVFASNGAEALAKAQEQSPDLILLDVMMPGMDGFEVCRRLRANHNLAEVPVIMISALDDRASRLQGIQAGADDFISKPFDRDELRARIRTIARLNRYRNLLAERSRFESLIQLSPDAIFIVDEACTISLHNLAALELIMQGDSQVIEGKTLEGRSFLDLIYSEHIPECREKLSKMMAGAITVVRLEINFILSDWHSLPVEIHAGRIEWEGRSYIQIIARDIRERKLAETQLKTAYADLEYALDQTISGWARALELHDQETEGHSRRVEDLMMEFANRFDFTPENLVHIRRGAILHDIGKMGVPDKILQKPGKLNEDEWEVITKHPEFSLKILAPIFFLKPALPIPLCHHEKWDGSGYPNKLKGEDIPLEARIFAVIDVWDALTNERCYHKAWSKAEALEFIRRQSGSHFDPDIVRKFLAIMAEKGEKETTPDAE